VSSPAWTHAGPGPATFAPLAGRLGAPHGGVWVAGDAQAGLRQSAAGRRTDRHRAAVGAAGSAVNGRRTDPHPRTGSGDDRSGRTPRVRADPTSRTDRSNEHTVKYRR